MRPKHAGQHTYMHLIQRATTHRRHARRRCRRRQRRSRWPRAHRKVARRSCRASSRASTTCSPEGGRANDDPRLPTMGWPARSQCAVHSRRRRCAPPGTAPQCMRSSYRWRKCPAHAVAHGIVLTSRSGMHVSRHKGVSARESRGRNARARQQSIASERRTSQNRLSRWGRSRCTGSSGTVWHEAVGITNLVTAFGHLRAA